MKTTYSETRNQKPFDWRAFLECALEVDPSYENYKDACCKAGDWVTCAC